MLTENSKKFFSFAFQKKEILNIANLLSIYRIFASPFIYIFTKKSVTSDFFYILNFIVILSVILSDFLDGFFSRKFNTSTVIGRYIDAFSDKVALVFTGIAFYQFYGFPLLMIVIIIIREFFIIVLTFLATRKKIIIETNRISKIAFFLLALLIVLYYLRIPELYKSICLSVTLVFYITSLFLYLKDYKNK